MKGLNLECGMTRKRIFCSEMLSKSVTLVKWDVDIFYSFMCLCVVDGEMRCSVDCVDGETWNVESCNIKSPFFLNVLDQTGHCIYDEPWVFEIVVNSNCNWLMISFIIFIFSTNNMPEPWKFFSPWNSEPTLFLSSLSLLLSLSFKSDQKKTCLQVEWSLRNGNIFASDKASSKKLKCMKE